MCSLPPAASLDRPQRPVVGDVLHDPQLPVRHTQTGVVLPRLNQVAPPDGEAVAAGRGCLVIYGSGVGAVVADALVQACGLIVGGNRDRLPILSMLGDVLAQTLGIRVETDQTESCELVKDRAGVGPVAQPH